MAATKADLVSAKKFADTKKRKKSLGNTPMLANAGQQKAPDKTVAVVATYLLELVGCFAPRGHV
jgi:hypothetical protein